MDPDKRAIVVIAHRGASGLRPEHTLAAYALAIDQGADFIEPDLVPTRDGFLVARHENEISETTDIADHPEFADRRTTKTIDGRSVTGWFTEDFMLAELKTLRARERLPTLRPRNAEHDGAYEIPTLDEIIALAKRRGVGIYPETKHPSYFASIGLSIEAPLVERLRAAGWDDETAPVFIQSFEVSNLKRIRSMTRIRLIQLIAAQGGPADDSRVSYAAMTDLDGMRAVAAYADGVGPDKALLWHGASPSGLVSNAHAAGLQVHPWTFRAENHFLPQRYRQGSDPAGTGDMRAEIDEAIAQGVDGFFTDFPLIGAAARDAALG